MFSLWLRKELFVGTKLHFLIAALFSVCTITIAALYIRLTQSLVDELINSNNLRNVLYLAFVIMMIRLFQLAIRELNSYNDKKITLLLSHNVEHQLLNSIRFSTITYTETPKYRNEVEFIKLNIGSISQFILSLFKFAEQIILMITYSVLIVVHSWVTLPLILLYCIPKLILEIKNATFRFSYVEQTMELNREKNLMVELMTQPDAQKEIFIFSMKPYLLQKWRGLSELNIKSELVFKKTESFKNVCYTLSGPIGFLVVQLILLKAVLSGSISVGGYISMTTAIGLLEGTLFSICSYMGRIRQVQIVSRKIMLFLSTYTLSQTTVEHNKFQENIEQIEIVDLSFQYPGASSRILNRINCTFNKGDSVIIVGDNGSGKTTLAKIIMGLHDVGPGTLYYNGRDIEEINREDLYKQISMVAQDYITHPFSLAENITLRKDEDSKNKFEQFIQMYPFLIPEHVKDDLDRRLGTEYAGAQQLSGGQWQKIAIARALYKDSSLLVLDEATSALDPETEMMLIKKILENRNRKTTVIVTHRLSITKMANKIIVMHNGQILEQGSHEELLEARGKYYNMYMAQVGGEERGTNVQAYEFQRLV